MCTRHGEQTASGWVPAGGGWREAGGMQHCGFTIWRGFWKLNAEPCEWTSQYRAAHSEVTETVNFRLYAFYHLKKKNTHDKLPLARPIYTEDQEENMYRNCINYQLLNGSSDYLFLCLEILRRKELVVKTVQKREWLGLGCPQPVSGLTGSMRGPWQ